MSETMCKTESGQLIYCGGCLLRRLSTPAESELQLPHGAFLQGSVLLEIHCVLNDDWVVSLGSPFPATAPLSFHTHISVHQVTQLKWMAPIWSTRHWSYWGIIKIWPLSGGREGERFIALLPGKFHTHCFSTFRACKEALGYGQKKQRRKRLVVSKYTPAWKTVH